MVEFLSGHVEEKLSWVPQWHRKEYVRSSVLSNLTDETGFCAAGNVPIRIEETCDAEVLAVHGQRLDRVTYVSKIISWYQLFYGEQTQSTRIFDLWKSFQEDVGSKYGIASYPTGEDLRRVFCKTLIAGLDEHGKPAGEEFWEHFLRQYAVELEDSRDGQTFEQRKFWHAGFRNLQLHLLIEQTQDGNRAKYLAAFQRASEHRRLFLTAKGFLGLGPAAMEVGDETCVLFGANVPYVYRSLCRELLTSQGLIGPFSVQTAQEMLDLPAGSDIFPNSHDDCYLLPPDENIAGPKILQMEENKVLIGHCYVHGMMHGEAVREFDTGESPSILFRFQ